MSVYNLLKLFAWIWLAGVVACIIGIIVIIVQGKGDRK